MTDSDAIGAEREPHKYTGYADGSACCICGKPRAHPLHAQYGRTEALRRFYAVYPSGNPSDREREPDDSDC